MPAAATGSSRTSTSCPSGSSTPAGRVRASTSARATVSTLRAATRSASRTSGSRRPGAAATASGSTRNDSGISSPSRSAISRSAASPPSRTPSTIRVTSSVTSENAGTSERSRPAGRAARDLLPDLEPVVRQRPAGVHEVNDPVGEADERRELHGALDLNDLGLAPRVLEVALGGTGVLRRDAHRSQAARGLAEALVALPSGDHHPAGAVTEVEQLVDRPVPLL